MNSNSPIPDSGSRTEFESGAVRDQGGGKGLIASIPPNFIRSVAKRFEDGAQKYGHQNWQKGIPLTSYLNSASRHTLQIAEGDLTEDHVGAVGWNMAAFQWTLSEIEKGNLPASLDDRPYKIPASPNPPPTDSRSFLAKTFAFISARSFASPSPLR